jgi:hypothetical protein
MWWPVLAILALLVGLSLILRGLRGRTIGDHPHCTKCGYDLFGNRRATRCSECGADLTAAFSVRIGQIKRRPRLIVGGSIVLFLVILPGCLIIIGNSRNYNWNQLKPSAWLQYEAFGPTTNLMDDSRQRADSAWAELIRRQMAGKLTARRASSMVDVILRKQRDPGFAAWKGDWGEFVEKQRGDGNLDDKRWATYMEQGLDPSLSLPVEVRQGEPISLSVHLNSRLGNGFHARHVSGSVSLGRWTFAGEAGNSGEHAMAGWGLLALEPLIVSPEDFTSDPIPPGEYEVSYTPSITVWPNPARTPNPSYTWTAPLRGKVHIIAASPPVETAADPMVDAIRAAISVELDARNGGRALITIKEPPVDLAFEAFVRIADSAESRIGFVSAKKGADGRLDAYGWNRSEKLKQSLPSAVTFVFRPRIDWGKTDNQSRIWKKTIEIPDVQVKRDFAGPASAASNP